MQHHKIEQVCHVTCAPSNAPAPVPSTSPHNHQQTTNVIHQHFTLQIAQVLHQVARLIYQAINSSYDNVNDTAILAQKLGALLYSLKMLSILV